ncbi:aromatic aminobenezylarsenical efflux permease ArsG family transporter [bacterium]
MSWLILGSAIWLGILTSISPCPLATNIAAMSFLVRQVEDRKKALIQALAYTLGRTLTYILLGSILVSSARLIPKIAMFLQRVMHTVLGPVLIAVGLILLNIFHLPIFKGLLNQEKQKRLGQSGWPGALALGILFALSFCPVSAALFFGSTLGLAMQHQSRFLIPGLYGFGTALPVVGFALLLSLGVQHLASAFNRITSFENWARKISGVIFIIAGIYLLIRSI